MYIKHRRKYFLSFQEQNILDWHQLVAKTIKGFILADLNCEGSGGTFFKMCVKTT